MSSIIFTENVPTRPAENITLFGVQRKQNLADLIRRELNANPDLTLRRIAERSRGGVTHSYLSKILAGTARNPSIGKLKAIAKGLGLPEKEVFAAAGGSQVTEEYEESEFAALFYKYKELKEEDRVALRDLLRIVDREIERRRK